MSGTTLSQTSFADRDETFDILKGIAIILMVVGHCEVGPLGPFINSFHMPLFFFVTGYFLKIRPIGIELKLSSKRLLVPYAFTALCICIAALCEDISHYTWADGSHTQGTIIKYLLGFKGEVSPEWLVGAIGVPWFILAMFWARIILVTGLLVLTRMKGVDPTKKDMLLCLATLVLGIVGLTLQKNVFVPFCIPQGLLATGFIYAGYLIKKHNVLDGPVLKQIFPFVTLVWLYSWSQGGVGMSSCWYPTGQIFGMVGALGAFIALFAIVKKLYDRKVLLWRCIHFWGRYSLVFYCVHAIEHSCSNWKAFALLHHIPLEHFGLFQVSIRLTIAFVFTLFLLKIKPIREQIFQIKNNA